MPDITIGFDKLYYAKITEDASGNETYGTPSVFAKAIDVTIDVEYAEGSINADDFLLYYIKLFKSGKVKLGTAGILPDVMKDVFGVRIDAKGVIIRSAEDMSPTIALGFRAKNPKGGYLYYWLYRVQLNAPAFALNTLGDSIQFNTPSIDGTIYRRNKEDSTGEHPWIVYADENDSGTNATVITNWFSSVYEATYSDATVSLSALTIGSVSLSPTFDAAVTSYTASTSNATNTVTATPADNTADVVITVNGDSLTNGGSATWETGTNAVVITVSKGGATKTYNVTVTKN